MPDIESQRSTAATKYATGIDHSRSINDPNRAQVRASVTAEQFKKVKDEALRQDVTIGEVIRQLIDLL